MRVAAILVLGSALCVVPAAAPAAAPASCSGAQYRDFDFRLGTWTVRGPKGDKWHQTWVDSSGSLLLLDGGLHGRALHRIVWTPLTDGRVRQHWQMSYDNGATWHEVFDGYYSRS